MTNNQTPFQFKLNLSTGDLVTIGARIYQANFKQYLWLAFSAHLLLLIPVYGWARFCEISALLSGLTFANLTAMSAEEIQAVYGQAKRKKWQLLSANILTSLIIVLGIVLLILALFIVAIAVALVAITVFSFVFGSSPTQVSTISTWTGYVFGVLILVLPPVFSIWIQCRFFVTEISLLNGKLGAIAALKRSRTLTKRFTSQIGGAMAIAVCLTIPIALVVQFIGLVAASISVKLIWNNDQQIYNQLGGVVLIILSFVLSVITMPFWQSIKAVTYFEVLRRQEGFGLRLREQA